MIFEQNKIHTFLHALYILNKKSRECRKKYNDSKKKFKIIPEEIKRIEALAKKMYDLKEDGVAFILYFLNFTIEEENYGNSIGYMSWYIQSGGYKYHLKYVKLPPGRHENPYTVQMKKHIGIMGSELAVLTVQEILEEAKKDESFQKFLRIFKIHLKHNILI